MTPDSDRNAAPPVPPGGNWYSNAELTVRVARLEDDLQTHWMLQRILERELAQIRQELNLRRVAEEAVRGDPPRGLR
ncbi:MAG TPA: hypothetical protein VGV64_07795 [Thermoplasmata archaeon]|nr:hypothetical protein [Thermoplasmata archaeon]HEV2429725.1 hypothetical protein [Thermoplasmata archaeon]